MRILNVIVALMILGQSNVSHAVEYDSRFTRDLFEERGVKPDQCIRSVGIGMRIVSKLEDHTYQTVNVSGFDIVNSRSILKTIKSDFKTTGEVKIMIRYRGVQEMNENGFPVKFGVWEECK